MRQQLVKLYIGLEAVREAAKDEQGQDLIEYALLGCVIAGAVVAISGPLQTAISTAFSQLTSSINAA